MIQKIEDLLFSTEINVKLKVLLIKTMHNFRDGMALCDRIYALGIRLLAASLPKEVTIASFNLLTHVASKGMKVGEHVDFLMKTIEEYSAEPIFLKTLFMNLAQISKSSYWEEVQVEVSIL